jgi:hypothetical protein
MNKIFLLLFLIVFASCGQSDQKSNDDKLLDMGKQVAKAEDTLQTLINANINKQPAIDTIFGGFSFSMTKMQAMLHYNEMKKEKKLLMNKKDDRYEYPMAFEVNQANATPIPEFQNDKLYKLTLLIEPVGDIATNDMIFSEATIAYLKKYGARNLFTEQDIIDPKVKKYHWIESNLQIFLYKSTDATMVEYINMPVQQLIDKQKAKEKDSTKSATDKNI